MGRVRRMDAGGMVYHALNRASFRSALFRHDGGEKVSGEKRCQVPFLSQEKRCQVPFLSTVGTLAHGLCANFNIGCH